MSTVHLLLLDAGEVPASDDWLAPEEREQLARFRIDKRRGEWRMGRFAAKRLLARVVPGAADPAAVVVRAAEDGAPEAFVGGSPAGVTLSISHANGVALCAAAPGTVLLGCDVEQVERRSDAFVRDYFTAGEVSRLAAAADADRPLLANLVWSAKESTLKALREGLRLDTRSVEVEVPRVTAPGEWAPLRCRHGGTGFDGWWMHTGARVLTVVVRPGVAAPPRMAG